MKSITTLILLSIGIMGMGQKKYTTVSTVNKDSIILNSGLLTMGIDTPKFVTDTVRCVMLVCDTTHYSSMSAIIGLIDDTTNLYYHPSGLFPVWWQSGYAVSGYYINRSPYMPNWGYDNFKDYYEYLDDKKKPLNKNIIVWMSRQPPRKDQQYISY